MHQGIQWIKDNHKWYIKRDTNRYPKLPPGYVWNIGKRTADERVYDCMGDYMGTYSTTRYFLQISPAGNNNLCIPGSLNLVSKWDPPSDKKARMVAKKIIKKLRKTAQVGEI